ncbi:hypothetical protein J6590_021683 [Homalodisca vitripennis]|nr:hypothetical protein J6590_021683 [Homalodisca vitripennis]
MKGRSLWCVDTMLRPDIPGTQPPPVNTRHPRTAATRTTYCADSGSGGGAAQLEVSVNVSPFVYNTCVTFSEGRPMAGQVFGAGLGRDFIFIR